MRVSQDVPKCIAYLYPSRESAIAGEGRGATGFFVYVSSPHPPPNEERYSFTHVYLVTNDHVVRQAGGALYVRVNRRAGPPLIFLLRDGVWHAHPDGDDVAVCYLGCDPMLSDDVHLLSSERFITQQDVESGYVGLGDDCMMVGRFALHPGTHRNIPVVRFGNVSMLPEEGVDFELRGHRQEAFLVEMRSRAGFSGSPVFLLPQLTWNYDNVTSVLSYDDERRDETLGIVCGHFKKWLPIKARQRHAEMELEAEIEDNSGMAIIIPAWRIQMIFDSDTVAAERKNEESLPPMQRRRIYVSGE